MTEKRLKTLAEKRAALELEEKRLRARNRKEERRKDTRRKILIGSMLTTYADKNPRYQARLSLALDRFLTRKSDRDLFDLDASEASSRSGN